MSAPTQPRVQAFQLLCALLEKKQSLAYLITPKTHPMAKELCFGVCRYYFYLDSKLKTLATKPIKDLPVKVCLMMGLYALDHLDQPAYATVQETVGLLDKTPYVFAKALVNAILRRHCREQEESKSRLSLPVTDVYEAPWLAARLKQDWPEDWQQVMHANTQRPPMMIRVNRSKMKRDDYLAILEKEGIQARAHAYLTCAIELMVPVNVDHLPGFEQGDVSVQDVSAQCAVELLQLKPHARVLDACAAPGGKTGQLLECESTLELFALDKEAKRLKKVSENLQRLHYEAQLIHADATSLQQWWDGEAFDTILLDAPCSATGVIRRHPDIRILRTAEEVTEIASVQASLLTQLWQTLRVGGQLLYVTCSVLRQENDDQIRLFLEHHAEATLQPIHLPWGRATAFGWQCLPGEGRGDGFYFSLIKK
jgi:16S rRNA (cytosine967-C5)-methyltransferase